MRFYASLFLVVTSTAITSAFVQRVSSHLDLRTDRENGVCRSSATSAESEAERLLRKARELREKAALAEHQVHVEQAEKKALEDAKLDELINKLFFEGNSLVDCLHEKNLCIDTLESIVDRLDEREVIAEGREHVEMVNDEKDAKFERVSERDEEELARIQGCIDDLIEGVKVLDEEFQMEKESKSEVYISHTEDQHWGAGKRAERLRNRAHEIRREREDQFQNRMEEFYEAQRIKKNHSPPPKAKDEHGLLP